MFVLPAIAVFIEARRKQEHILELVGKWFIFFGVGVRLLVAGLTQIFVPSFTVDLLQADSSVLILVQELGFTNLLLAGIALLSLFKPNYRVIGTAGAFYMGFAGILHLSRASSDMTSRETIALWSDLWICLVAIVYLAYKFLEKRKQQKA